MAYDDMMTLIQKIPVHGINSTLASKNMTTLLEMVWPFHEPKLFEPFSWEKIPLPLEYYWISTSQSFPIYLAGIYILAIFLGQNYMKNKKPWDLRLPLFYWNTVLGIFSVLGFYRVFQELYVVLRDENGFYNSVCVRSYLHQPAKFWGFMFTISKIVELGDTIFIVLRKQKLILLQWFHHALAMVLAFRITCYAEPIVRWYMVMNFGVHALMYPYFALKACRFKIPRKISMALTTLQLIQMVIGVTINFYTMYLYNSGIPCARHPESIKWLGGAYATFTVLFMQFFYDNYIARNKIKLS